MSLAYAYHGGEYAYHGVRNHRIKVKGRKGSKLKARHRRKDQRWLVLPSVQAIGMAVPAWLLGAWHTDPRVWILAVYMFLCAAPLVLLFMGTGIKTNAHNGGRHRAQLPNE